MKHLIITFLFLLVSSTIVSLFFIYQYINTFEHRIQDDIKKQHAVLARSMRLLIEPHISELSPSTLEFLSENISPDHHLGIALFSEKGTLIAVSPSSSQTISSTTSLVQETIETKKEQDGFRQIDQYSYYIYTSPLVIDKKLSGVIALIRPEITIKGHLNDLWYYHLARILLQALLLSIALLLITRWFIVAPIRSLTGSMYAFRQGKTSSIKLPHSWFFSPLAKELQYIKKTLTEARHAASLEARLRLEKLDSPWTEHRLKEFIKITLKDRKFYVISNRQPYSHTHKGSDIIVQRPASGMLTALDPIMQACEGMWIAHGSGDADKEVVDKHDNIKVPIDEPKYTLKRVWLSDTEIQKYYNGFSNEGIWPLCHMAHTRPIFRKEDWEYYQSVNRLFAHTLLKEIQRVPRPIILIQDYHFSLLPRMIKEKRPDALVALFWHIPWPHAEAFRICPWRKEILDGLLGADLIGFHIQLHCNNFLNTVSHELESLIDWEQFSVTKHDHTSLIKPFPISISFSGSSDHEEPDGQKIPSIQEELGIATPHIAVGVDRLDYTKGILERLTAIDILLQKHPEYHGSFTFVQIAAPTRDEVEHYAEFAKDVQEKIDHINKTYQTNTWKPIVFLHKLHTAKEIMALYKIASVCLVTSLHDGMNLVAKEFIAAREDLQGVMILSQFTGASRELKGAIIVNPYHEEETAEAIHIALTMPKEEQQRRMKKMRETVQGYNIYRWSAELLKSMVNIEQSS